jgi:hypothetical protein
VVVLWCVGAPRRVQLGGASDGIGLAVVENNACVDIGLRRETAVVIASTNDVVEAIVVGQTDTHQVIGQRVRV